MKAFLIDPVAQIIETTTISSMDDMIDLIGQDTLESDEISDEGDRIYFDENCFVRGTQGRFQIDSLIPLAGKCIVIGTAENGEALQNVLTDIEDLRNRIKYM